LIDRSEAEDVLQEVFITIWRKAAQFDVARASAMTWLVTIARNRAIDRLRSRPARPNVALEHAAEIADDRPQPDANLEADGESAKLLTALSTLDPRHATIIRAAFFEGLSYEALALREAVPIGTLKSWVRRGLLRMRSELAT
jgi:RNA polymerase sigma-70 factor (ECF subfamily)